ncbi:UNVERIFIED_CONTAM: hypothetical protein Sangu_2870200 [Sesamum angustifolium]|uniref:Aminotransferase-like plant mobile domain-containing protein n=1 Tax=Sesamum angustifolium TaxID=2727405 RepID=A0AAW2IPH2_9LAMI
MGGILCPDATGNTVSLLYLRHMEIIDEDRPSNWGTAVLAYLYRELCMASQCGKINIGGATQLLQIWAWSRIITLAPIPSNISGDANSLTLKASLPFHMLHDITGYRPTDTRDWEYVYNKMEQLVLDCDNSGDDIQSLRETRARNRAIGRDIMTFSSGRYPSVRGGPAGDEVGPSNVYNETGPSNFFTPTGPSYAYTSNMPFSSGDYAHNIHPETRRHLGISPVPFDGLD